MLRPLILLFALGLAQRAAVAVAASPPACGDAAKTIAAVHKDVRKAATCEAVKRTGERLASLKTCPLSEADQAKLDDAELDWNIKHMAMGCGKGAAVDCTKLQSALDKSVPGGCGALWHDRAALGRLRVCANSKEQKKLLAEKRKELAAAIKEKIEEKKCVPPQTVEAPERLADDQIRILAETRLREKTAAVAEAVKAGKTNIFELRKAQLDALAPYAVLVFSLDLPPGELEKAIAAIPWLQADAALVAALAKERPEVLGFAARVASPRPEDREVLLKASEQLDPALVPLLNEHWKGRKDALALALQLAQKHTEEELQRFSDSAGKVSNDLQKVRDQMLRMRTQRALYVLIEAPRRAECTGANLFVDEASSRLSSKEEVPLLTPLLPGELRDRAPKMLKTMLETCGNKNPPRGKTEPACGALLEVQILEEGAEYRGEAKLTFVLPPDLLSADPKEETKRVHAEHLFSIPAFEASCNSSERREKAVRALIDEVAARYSRFGNGIILEKEVPACMARTCHCGVRVNADAPPGVKPPATLAGLRLIGSCGPPQFVAAVKEGLRRGSHLVGEIVDEKVASGVPQLLFSKDASDDCTANLSVRQRPTWSAKAIVNTQARCERLPLEIWSSAGQDVADELLTFYRSGLAIQKGASGPPVEKADKALSSSDPYPDADWAHASQAWALAGLPWLTDGLETRGEKWAVAASVADAVLLVSSVAALAYSTHLREEYATFEVNTRSYGDTLQTVGLVLGGTVLAARLTGFLVYRLSDTLPPNGSGARSGLSVGANGFGLQF